MFVVFGNKLRNDLQNLDLYLVPNKLELEIEEAFRCLKFIDKLSSPVSHMKKINGYMMPYI